jgi:hypothetical protein
MSRKFLFFEEKYFVLSAKLFELYVPYVEENIDNFLLIGSSLEWGGGVASGCVERERII